MQPINNDETEQPDQWRSKFVVGRCAKIPKGPPRPLYRDHLPTSFIFNVSYRIMDNEWLVICIIQLSLSEIS